MRIRRVMPEDIPAITELERVCFSVPWSEQGFMAELDSGDAWFSVCEENDKILGFAVLHCFGEEAELFNVAVSPEVRRRGIADALMRDVMAGAKKKDVTRILLEVRRSNVPAISLYAKYGFELLGLRKNYYDAPVEDALILEVNLYKGGEEQEV